MGKVFLFGAGASYGSLDCSPNVPPLGAGLFRALQHQSGIAASVSPQLAASFEANFELGMSEFFRERNNETVPFLREMAAYLRRFCPGSGNLYHAIVELARRRGDVVLASLNYDLLLERAILETGFGLSYRGLPLAPRNIAVRKLHGSCNFLPQPGGVMRNVRVDTSQAHSGAAAFGMPIRATMDDGELEEFYRTQESLAPAIAMYAPGKRVLVSPEIVKEQQAHWRTEVAQADHIFVIGVGVNPDDDHVWAPLAHAPGRLGYVGRSNDQKRFEAWAKGVGRQNFELIGDSFETSIPRIRDLLQTRI
jgi:hypothetical protein